MKKLLFWILAPVILVGMMSITAFAAEGEHTHTYIPTVTAPTCTEQGYTTYTCACGESYVGDYVDATGHSYQNGLCIICGERERMCGDVDNNGTIDTNDAVYILRYAAQLDEFDETQLRCADADGDGMVDERDAVAILRYAAKLDAVLGGAA